MLHYCVNGEGIENGINLEELMHKVLPESIGKTGKDLEPYTTKFNDAFYFVLKKHEPRSGGNDDEHNVEWKTEHGYLEGR